jgi:hypothetical protein
MKKILLTIPLFCFSFLSYAGNVSGTVGSYIVSSGYSKVFLHVNGTSSGQPVCSGGGDWAIDLAGTNPAGGKAALAAIIAASIQGKTITVIGTGDCSVWGDRETVSYIVFN